MIEVYFKAKLSKEIEGKVEGLLILRFSNLRSSSHKLFYQRSRFLPYFKALKTALFSEKKETLEPFSSIFIIHF